MNLILLLGSNNSRFNNFMWIVEKSVELKKFETICPLDHCYTIKILSPAMKRKSYLLKFQKVHKLSKSAKNDRL